MPMAGLLSLPLIVLLIGLAALAMFVPALHALVLGDDRVARGFGQSALLFLLLFALLATALRGRRPANPARSQLASFAGAYLVLPLQLAVPVIEVVRDTTTLNAWFEMLSCLTTTGASVYDAPGRLPESVHLWRALVGWLGGLLILVGAAAILAPLDLGGAEVISGRLPGRGAGAVAMGRADAATRLSRMLLALFPAYAGLTLALWVVLLTLGVDSFAALCLAMATLSSSGILPGPGLPAYGGGLVEVAVAAFLIIGLSRRFLPHPVLVDRSRSLWHDVELRTAGAVLAGVTAVLVLRHWLAAAADPAGAENAGSVLTAVWGTAFTALGFLTTSGLESHHWQAARVWSGLTTPGLVLLGLAMVGGGIATTTGGVKLLRLHALFAQGQREMQRIVHPRSVAGGGAEARRLRSEGAEAAWVFLVLYSLTLTALVGVLTLLGTEIVPALILGVAAVSTTGPLATLAADPPIRYADLGDAVKVALGVGMVLGRLEILAILALLAPSAWRR